MLIDVEASEPTCSVKLPPKPSAELAEDCVFEYVRCAFASCVTDIEYEPGNALPLVLTAIAALLDVPE